MSKKVRFSDEKSIIVIENCNNGFKVSAIKKYSKKYKKNNSGYSQQNAYCVAKRIEYEINNPIQIIKRINNELLLEYLLYKLNLHNRISRIYRLSDFFLQYLIKRYKKLII